MPKLEVEKLNVNELNIEIKELKDSLKNDWFFGYR